jgi:FG-GAP-like repeat/RTX calcium-binding nonapeptide repeat (4 copies)/FG-GAP repeat
MSLGPSVSNYAIRYDRIESSSVIDANLLSIAASNVDLVIIQPARVNPGVNDDEFITTSQINTIRNGPDVEMVAAYFSIGRPEVGRDVYAGLDLAFDDNGRSYLRYHELSTRLALIDYAVALANRGYDALFLDDVDAFFAIGPSLFGGDAVAAARSMMSLIVEINAAVDASTGRNVKIIVNNAPYLINDLLRNLNFMGEPGDPQLVLDYLAAIDALLLESVYGSPSERSIIAVANGDYRPNGRSDPITFLALSYSGSLSGDNLATWRYEFYRRAARDRVMGYGAPNDGLGFQTANIALNRETSGDDVLWTGDNGGYRSGGQGMDFLLGGYSNDAFYGGAGNDLIDGDAGFDVAYFGGLASNAVVRRSIDGGFRVTSVDGNDQLYNMERLEFSDTSITLDRVSQSDRHFGDFNGDGRADVLWRNDDGMIATWQMSGSSVVCSGGIASVDLGWRLLGEEDFNGDGRADLLWRRDNTLAIWIMNGTSLESGSGGAGQVDSTWQVSGLADYNGDGRGDILWTKDNGTVGLWYMNGTLTQSASVIGQAGLDWEVVGSGHVDLDNRADILWFNKQSRELAIWFMTASGTRSVVVGSLDDGWQVSAVADFNGDGRSDLALRAEDGRFAIQTLGGAVFSNRYDYGVIDPSWRIQGTGDFTQDGRADIFWSNRNLAAPSVATDQNAIWVMGVNGTFSAQLTSQSGTSWLVR